MSGVEATVDYSVRDSSSRSDSFTPKIEVVVGGEHALSAETEALLRVRLRAASMLLLIAFLVFFIRGLLLAHRDVMLETLHAFVLLVLAGSTVLLSSRRPIEMGRLRTIEVTVFGMVVLFLAIGQYRLLVQYGRHEDQTLAVTTMKSSVLYLFATMAMYGIFIPNQWRRAARVIVPMALTPTAVVLLVKLTHPEIIPFARRIATFEQVSENVLMMFLGAVSSIFGTHIISTLRTEAFEARQLGQYRLGERIGAGGMGEVYLAEHRLLKRPCAIKLIKTSRSTDPKALARFEREVRTTAQLSHGNTVEIYDYGRTDDGTFYYVMEYLPGLSLDNLVGRYGPLPAERVIHLIAQACDALREAHAAGLIHRDIKPANIFAAQRGGLYDVTKLLDFGLVKPIAESYSAQLSQEGSITGSPLYMSPEQAGGERLPDGRSDIYSLGAVAYFLLTGRPPFEGETAISVLIAHARDPVTPPSKLAAEVSADLERVVLRCLSKDPADRFQDAESLGRALRECEAAGRWTQDRAVHWWQRVQSSSGSTDTSPLGTTIEHPA